MEMNELSQKPPAHEPAGEQCDAEQFIEFGTAVLGLKE